MQNHILSIILFTPLVGAFILLFVPKENKDAIRWMANIFSFGGFLISLPLVPMFWAHRFDPQQFKFLEGTVNNWIPSIGAGYNLGIDGISFLLIMLTTLLGWISILSSWTAIEIRVKEYYVWFLLLQTGMLGVFMALDFFLFFVFWEAMLVPMYLLIGIWGGPRKLYAAIKFFLYTLLGSVLMLLGILFLYFHHHTLTGFYTFSIHALYKTAPQIPIRLRDLAVPGVLCRICHQGADVPLPHLAAGRARRGADGGLGNPGRRSAEDGDLRLHPLLAALLSPMRRFRQVRGWMIGLSIIAIIYGALVSLNAERHEKAGGVFLRQPPGLLHAWNLRAESDGLSGSVLQQINHGISTGALFLIVGILYERRHTREISEYGGISNVMPVYATITMISSCPRWGCRC